MVCSLYKLNKQGDNNASFTYSFPNFEAIRYSVSVPFLILSVIVWERSVFSLVTYNLSVPFSGLPFASPSFSCLLSGPYEKDALTPDVQNPVLGIVHTHLLQKPLALLRFMARSQRAGPLPSAPDRPLRTGILFFPKLCDAFQLPMVSEHGVCVCVCVQLPVVSEHGVCVCVCVCVCVATSGF